jgi:nucleotide-binding universal stress UspA family protein
MTFEIERILVGVDFSECSAAALRLAVRISETYEAPLTVLHSIPAADDSPLSRRVHLPERGQTLSTIENDLILFIRAVIGRKRMLDYRIVEGHPSEAILFAAGYEKTSLIVLGTRGRGGLSRLTMGSIAEQVLRQATVPVLTICPHRATRRRPADIRRILCPVNYSSAAGRAIEVASSVGKRLGAEVTALYAIEEKSFDGDLEAEADRLRAWTRGLVGKPLRITPLVVKGTGSAEILRYLQDNDIDLVVVAARRERFSDATVFGTTTERVTRHAPCAVLTVTEIAESQPKRRR